MFAPSALIVFSRSFLLFFYSQVVGLDPWLAGIALTIGRVWDAISDPVMGAISDRTRSRWGRRRPYIMFGAIPLAIAYVSMWVPPTGWSQTGLFVYLMVTDIVFNTLVTVVVDPVQRARLGVVGRLPRAHQGLGDPDDVLPGRLVRRRRRRARSINGSSIPRRRSAASGRRSSAFAKATRCAP